MVLPERCPAVQKEVQLIEGDNFRMILTVPEFGENPAPPPEVVTADGRTPQVTPQVGAQVRAQVGAQVGAQVILRVLKSCAFQPRSSKEIALDLGHKTLSGNLRRTLPELREKGLLEYTIPNKPNSRLQKYRLTDKGRKTLEHFQEKDPEENTESGTGGAPHENP